jgi:Fe-S-cluster containining protein
MLAKRLAALNLIYAAYDDFTKTLDIACKKHCAHCCTTNVTLTTLEGYRILDGLVAGDQAKALETIRTAPGGKHIQPKMTFNQLAALCANGIEPPKEEAAAAWQPCRFLIENQCLFYELRPFACRCLVSRHNCGRTGFAEVDDFVLSVHTVFIQIIEHVDRQGCSGNLMDILKVMVSAEHRRAYAENSFDCSQAGLIANHPLRALMIPPEHRLQMEPILDRLRSIRL